MEILDLTMPIDERTPAFPGSPKQELKQVSTIKGDGYNEKRISFNSHFSTHIDAPFHMLENGKRFQCYILPLKIKDGDGAPCRIIAIANKGQHH